MKTQASIPIDSLNLSIVETCRQSVRQDAVERYKSALENANSKWIFPSLHVWQNDGINYLLDGHHRLLAAKAAGLSNVPVSYQTFATYQVAKRYALHINSTHGERLTREETKANIKAFLCEGGAIQSDTAIASLFGVSRALVADVRANRDQMTKKERVVAEVAKVLAENPNATITEISEKAQISRPTAKKVAKSIEAKTVKKIDGIITDCFGREVPQNNIDKLVRIKSALKGCSVTLNDLSTAYKRMLDVGAFATASEAEVFDNALTQIRHILKQRRPDALCTCRGDGCRRCGGVGFLEKTMFNVVVPEFDK